MIPDWLITALFAAIVLVLLISAAFWGWVLWCASGRRGR